jgi:hypothetical protein
MSDLTMSILGFPAVNRDLSVQLLDPVTQNVVRTVTPFLDGTVRVPNIDPGAYEINVLHPNLPTPVLRRPIRVLPVGPTSVTVLIDPSRFRDTPIEDIPDANLTPVADMTKSVAETMTALGTKVAGEVIKAQDWNTLVGGVRDLANTTGELTQLVSPIGHDHPELVAKINEMQTSSGGAPAPNPDSAPAEVGARSARSRIDRSEQRPGQGVHRAGRYAYDQGDRLPHLLLAQHPRHGRAALDQARDTA